MKINKNSLKRELSYEVMLIPAVVGFAIFFIYPVLVTFARSVTDWNSYSRTFNYIGLQNFRELFHDKPILMGLKNSIIYAIIMTIFQNLLAIPLAVALDRNLKTKNILRTIIFAPAVLSPLVVGFLWSYIMAPTDYALLNRLLGVFKIAPVNWLGEPKIALYSIILTQLWQWTGWAMVIYIANLQSIPSELYEAAKIDGATRFQSFLNITIPMLFPSVTINSVSSMIGGLKVFDIVYAMTGGGPGYATETIISILITRGFKDGRHGYSCAFSVIFFGLVAIVTLIQLKLLKKWEDSVV